ncbi:hypothetical protein [Actinomadura gamaensis]|uniref:Uncharacterized protein n=1 Tax=Actinomadura gamaensis TaxID=1763541 RepID=A0ABV9U6A4_9ACTN
MTVRRMLVVAVGALVPTVLYVLVVANQWVYDGMVKVDVDLSRGLGPLLRISQAPGWRVTGADGRMSGPAGDLIFAQDISTFFFLLILTGLVFGGARALSAERGLFSAVVLGWWATFVAAGVTGFLRGFLYADALHFPSGEYSLSVWQTASTAAQFGFWFGWLGGLGAMVSLLILRATGSRPPRTQPPASPYTHPAPGYPAPALPPTAAPAPTAAPPSTAALTPAAAPAATPTPPPAQYAQPGYPQWAPNVPPATPPPNAEASAPDAAAPASDEDASATDGSASASDEDAATSDPDQDAASHTAQAPATVIEQTPATVIEQASPTLIEERPTASEDAPDKNTQATTTTTSTTTTTTKAAEDASDGGAARASGAGGGAVPPQVGAAERSADEPLPPPL